MESEKKFCKKIVYRNYIKGENARVLYGLIVEENDHFVIFKTDKNEFTINKTTILSMEDTKIVFRKGVE